jgi:hypothetical protein
LKKGEADHPTKDEESQVEGDWTSQKNRKGRAMRLANMMDWCVRLGRQVGQRVRGHVDESSFWNLDTQTSRLEAAIDSNDVSSILAFAKQINAQKETAKWQSLTFYDFLSDVSVWTKILERGTPELVKSLFECSERLTIEKMNCLDRLKYASCPEAKRWLTVNEYKEWVLSATPKDPFKKEKLESEICDPIVKFEKGDREKVFASFLVGSLMTTGVCRAKDVMEIGQKMKILLLHQGLLDFYDSRAVEIKVKRLDVMIQTAERHVLLGDAKTDEGVRSRPRRSL